MTPPQWYVPLPSGFARATKVSLLRAEFGALGVALPAVLLAEAETQKQQAAETQKQQGAGRGYVKMTYGDLAHLTASTPDEVRSAAERWSELGELVDVDFRQYDFTARWRDWDLWQPPAKRSAVDRAEAFLQEALAGGQRGSAAVESVANDLGISTRTLDQARKNLGVEATKEGVEWYMSLPDTRQGRNDAD